MQFILPKKEDFKFDLAQLSLNNPNHIIRMICGLFLLPEAYGKYSHFLQLNPATIEFFAKVGFHPAAFWVYLASFGEVVCGLALFLGICTRYAALGAAIILITACISLNIVRGSFAWTWSMGGDEYLIFWAICCVSVIVYEFNRLKHA